MLLVCKTMRANRQWGSNKDYLFPVFVERGHRTMFCCTQARCSAVHRPDVHQTLSHAVPFFFYFVVLFLPGLRNRIWTAREKTSEGVEVEENKHWQELEMSLNRRKQKTCGMPVKYFPPELLLVKTVKKENKERHFFLFEIKTCKKFSFGL